MKFYDGVTGAVSSQIFYNGSFTYSKDGTAAMSLRDMQTPEGVVVKTATGYAYRYFMRDYLNSVRYVSGIEQLTDYDPLGSIISSVNLDKNSYLYESKERYTDFSDAYDGVYDFGARFYNPLYGRWFAPDPAKQGINPYIYCGNNPVMLVDPDGRIWIEGQKAILMAQFRQMVRTLRWKRLEYMSELADRNLEEGERLILNKAIEDINDRIKGLKKDRDNIRALDKDDTIYEMKEYHDKDLYVTRQAEDGHVIIEFETLGMGAHEREHNVQWLGDDISDERFNNRFNDAGFLTNAGEGPDTWTANEKSAYQLQYSYDGTNSFPGNISSYKDINAVSIYNIMDGKLYPYAANSNEYKQFIGSGK